MDGASLWIWVFGVFVGASGAFFSGFLSKAGGDFYQWLSKKYLSDDREFVEVDGRFNPAIKAGESLAWVAESKIYEYKASGYRFRCIDEKKNGCFRKTSNGSMVYREYLMVKPI